MEQDNFHKIDTRDDFCYNEIEKIIRLGIVNKNSVNKKPLELWEKYQNNSYSKLAFQQYNRIDSIIEISSSLKLPNNFIHIYKYSTPIWCTKMKNLKSHKTPLQLKCPRCSRVWYYRGSNSYYASCSFCKCSVNVRKNRVQVDSMVGASNQPEQSDPS